MDSLISSNNTHSLETKLPNHLFDECNHLESSNFLPMVHNSCELAHNSQSFTMLEKDISSYHFLFIFSVIFLQSQFVGSLKQQGTLSLDKLTFIAFNRNGYFNVSNITDISFKAEVFSRLQGKERCHFNRQNTALINSNLMK